MILLSDVRIRLVILSIFFLLIGIDNILSNGRFITRLCSGLGLGICIGWFINT